uniref:Uncharacterized protein n=1 Tax=Leersia perrieri TaxID=77586 RepID=A0A0D9VPH7_9ORYZ
MAVPRRQNDVEDDAEIDQEEFSGPSDDEETPLPDDLFRLADAAQSGNRDALVAALDNYAGKIDDPIEDGDTLLHIACLYGHLPCVQWNVELAWNAKMKKEQFLFMMLALEYILKFAKDIDGCVEKMLNTVDSEGDTPLHHAARGEHLDVVNLLLDHGACPKKVNNYGQAPAEMADQGTEVQALLHKKQVEASTHTSN